MRTKHYLLITALFLCYIALGQQKFSPETLYSFPSIAIQKPIFIDSTNLKDEKFSEELLLSYSVSFPERGRFTTELKADTAGFFNIDLPATEYALRLFSFNVSADRYGKGKITITSPNPLELWIDDVKRATKTQLNDSLHHSGSVDTNLNGFTNNSRVVIKMLTSNKNKINPALKIEIKTEKVDSLLTYSFNNNLRRININDILEGKRINSSDISPSGRMLLLKYSEVLPGGDRQEYMEIYDTKEKKILISEKDFRSQLKWMPKSDLLTYISDGENGRSLYSLNPLTIETKTIAENLPKESFRFSPDEKSMFFSSKESITVSNPGGLKRMIGIDDRQSGYRDRYFIYQYHLETGLTQQITYGQQSAWLNDISEDSKKILFTVSEEDLSNRPFSNNSLYLLDLETMKTDTIWKKQTFVNSAIFSPDAKHILISGGGEAFGGIGLNIDDDQIANSYDTQSFIMNLSTKEIDPITKNFDPSIDSHQWNKFDNNIYFRVQDRDRENIYRYTVKSKKFEKLDLLEDVIRSFNLAASAPWASYTGVSSSNSNRSYLLNLKTIKSELISDPYADRLSKLNLGEVKDWSFTSSFGDEIEGRYYLPPNFNPNKKYPLIVYYYGGTSPTQRTFEGTYPLHVYAAQDFIVYTLQPSGTTGYGQEFAARHVNAWGEQTADEIIEGVKKFVDAHSFVDGTKIGNIGASYGGFMTQYLITRTDLFTASVSHAGISNITSYWGEGFWGYSYSSGASAGSYPWNNPRLYIEQSPLFKADKINTPLLLLHGSVDTNVPIGESIQMYTALKLLGKPVEFIQVEGENHAIYQYDKRIAWNNAIYAWFAKWLKNDSRWWDSMYPTK